MGRQSKIKEAEGDLVAASKILGELQIETYGSMKKKEKIEFILQQMRLTLLNFDFIRCGIVRGKITDKAIKLFPKLETTYWELSLKLFYLRDKEFIEMAKGYRRLFDLYGDPDKKLTCLANSIYTVSLAKHAPDQVTLLHSLNNTTNSSEMGKILEKIPDLRVMLKMFCTKELIPYPQNEMQMLQSAFRSLPNFQLDGIEDPNQIKLLM